MVKPTQQEQQQQQIRSEEIRKIRNIDLCMTFQDAIGDAGKPSNHTTDPTAHLFQQSLLSLTGKTQADCTFNYSNTIRQFVSQEVRRAQVIGIKQTIGKKKIPVEVHNLPFGDRIIPTIVSTNPIEVVIDFKDESIEISPVTLAALIAQDFAQGVVVTEADIKLRIKAYTLGRFKTIKDNAHAPPLPEGYNMSSLFDDATRKVRCGAIRLAAWLSNKYGSQYPRGTWKLDLFMAGLTSIPDSCIYAQWGGNIQLHPDISAFLASHNNRTATFIGGYALPILIAENQVLFTLKLGNDFVGCIFEFTEQTVAGEYQYSNSANTKIPVFYYFHNYNLGLAISLGDIRTFIIACFHGNATKNNWFTANNGNSGNLLYIIFGCLILEGKVFGDASFASTCDPNKEILGTNDYGSTARALLKKVPVSYCRFDATVYRENLFIVMIPYITEYQKEELKGIVKNMKSPEKSRKHKQEIILLLQQMLLRTGRTNRDKRALNREYRGLGLNGGTLTVEVMKTDEGGIAPAIAPDVAPAIAPDVAPAIAPDVVPVISSDVAPVIASDVVPDVVPVISSDVASDVAPDVAPHVFGDDADDGNADDGNADDDDDDSERNVSYLNVILSNKIEAFKEFCIFLESVQNQLEYINEKKTYILDGVSKRVNLSTFNIINKKLTIETVIKFIKKIIEIPVDVLVVTIIKSYSEQNLRFPSENEIVNMFSGIIQSDLFYDNPNEEGFLCSLPSYYFIDGFYVLYLLLKNGTGKGKEKLFDVDIFAPLIGAITDSNSNMNKFFADTNSQFPILSDLPNVSMSNNIGSLIKELVHLIETFFIENNLKYQSKKYYYETIISIITILHKKLENGEIEKYQFYKELSFNLYALSSLIGFNTLSFMIINSAMIVYSGKDNKLLAQCINNELITLTSTQGVSIFDLQIIESFIDGIDFNRETWSISYPRGYEGLYTLISIKKNIDGDLLESLNNDGFSLKQIGDFVDSVAFEAEEKSLSNKEITEIVETSILEKIQDFQKEQQRIKDIKVQPPALKLPGLRVGTGGKNNHKSKHNAKYRKKYKKFVSKYIIKKNKKQNNKKNKSTHSTNTKNKTKKNKKIAKNKSKYAKKTLKNKKRKSKSKSSNHKSKHNKKANTSYYNLYKHNKTLKH